MGLGLENIFRQSRPPLEFGETGQRIYFRRGLTFSGKLFSAPEDTRCVLQTLYPLV